MEVYCNSCGEKKPMKRIRKPRGGRAVAVLLILITAAAALSDVSWLLVVVLLILSLVMTFVGKNYWQCKTCGTLTERI